MQWLSISSPLTLQIPFDPTAIDSGGCEPKNCTLIHRARQYFKQNRGRIQRLSKEGGWILFGTVVSVMGSLVLVRVLTEYLLPSEYGRLTLTLTLGVLACQVAFTGSMPGIMRYYALAAEKTQLSAYFRASWQMFHYGIGVALALGGILLAGLVAGGRGEMVGLTLIAVILSILTSLNSTLSSIQNAARQRQVAAFHAGLDAWLKIALAVLLMRWLDASALPVVAGYTLSMLFVLASQAFFMRRLIPEQSPDATHCENWRRQIWEYSKPFVVFNIFTWAQASSDRWALEMLVGTSEVGFYSTLLQLGWAPISILTGLATTLLGPILFARSGDAQDSTRNQNVHRLSWQLTQLTLVLTGLGFVFTWCLHSLLFSMLVAPEYRKVSYLLPWMVLAGGLFAASQVLGLKMLSELKTHSMIWPKVVTSLLGVFFSFGGAYLFGLPGVVGGMVCFSMANLLWFSILAKRVA